LVEAVHVLPGGGGVEPDDDAAVALEQPVPAFLLTDVSVRIYNTRPISNTGCLQ
jgi:hypothetical protein